MQASSCAAVRTLSPSARRIGRVRRSSGVGERPALKFTRSRSTRRAMSSALRAATVDLCRIHQATRTLGAARDEARGPRSSVGSSRVLACMHPSALLYRPSPFSAAELSSSTVGGIRTYDAEACARSRSNRRSAIRALRAATVDLCRINGPTQDLTVLAEICGNTCDPRPR